MTPRKLLYALNHKGQDHASGIYKQTKFEVVRENGYFLVSIDNRAPVRVEGANAMHTAVSAAQMMIDEIVSKQKVRAK